MIAEKEKSIKEFKDQIKEQEAMLEDETNAASHDDIREVIKAIKGELNNE